MDDYEIRCVIKFLWSSGESNPGIVDKMHRVYGNGCVSLRTVQKWTCRFRNGEISLEDRERNGRPKNMELRTDVKALIDGDPFASARDIANRLRCDKDTVVKIFREDLQMSKVNIRWIPKQLSDFQKSERVRIASEMLGLLTDRRQHDLLYTQDETWVHLENPRKMMWVMSGAARPRETRRLQGARKVMLSVIFNTNGIASITMLPRGEKFTKIFFYNSVIADFVKNVWIPKTGDGRRKVKLHCDNAPSHRIDQELEALNISRVPHPPYSPDLAPCDFFLFGFLKMALEGRNLKSAEDLLAEVRVILESIPQTTLQMVYGEWVQRLHKCIQINGEYVE